MSKKLTMDTKLTGRQEKAAVLVAEDHFSNERIAQEIGITRRTLDFWKRQPQFMNRVAEIMREMAALARRRGIARRERRVAVLQETHDKLLRVIEERGADPTMTDIPGGRTGHVVRKAIVSAGELVGYEYAVDTATIKQLQSIQEQAAKELGHLVDRHEHRVIRSLEDLTDEEIEAIAAREGIPADELALGEGKG